MYVHGACVFVCVCVYGEGGGGKQTNEKQQGMITYQSSRMLTRDNN